MKYKRRIKTIEREFPEPNIGNIEVDKDFLVEKTLNGFRRFLIYNTNNRISARRIKSDGGELGIIHRFYDEALVLKTDDVTWLVGERCPYNPRNISLNE